MNVRNPLFVGGLMASLIFLSACGRPTVKPPSSQRIGTMHLSSPAFNANEPIPSLYTCDEKGINPPLQIADVPAEATSLVLIVDDPDAPSGDFVHWILYNVPVELTAIQAGAVPAGVSEGLSSLGKTGYVAPCPPSGTHRYQFTLYALDTILEFAAAPTKAGVEQAMEGHLLAQAMLVGTYQRR